MEPIIGLYIHQHWPYHRPYAARTWTLEEWRGWAAGLQTLGYNTVLIWPVLETMPDPLTPSDRVQLEKLGRVVAMLHDEMAMRVYLTLCPNIVAQREEASRFTFETRHYYYCDALVNPGDAAALDHLVRWREELLRPLARIDGLAIIDSDPGCYPGSTNAEFVQLLTAHRRMLDRLRSGIELIYWMHAGWRGWSRLYETGAFAFGTPEEHLETLTLLKEADPEPWGLANGLAYAEPLGLAQKVIAFNYGRIEGEPSFPMTNFGGTGAYEAGAAPFFSSGGQRGEGWTRSGRGPSLCSFPRGVMGNAQTHCVQLPNIYAFAQGAGGGQPRGAAPTDIDYAGFSEELIPGHGGTIVRAWQALANAQAETMREHAAVLEQKAAGDLPRGSLDGLLFGDPRRFLTDLALMLRLRAAREDLADAADRSRHIKEPLARFVVAAEAWQRRHGYQNNWHDPRLHAALRKLGSPAVDAVLSRTNEAMGPFDVSVTTPGEQVRRNFRAMKTFTPDLIRAMRTALEEMG